MAAIPLVSPSSFNSSSMLSRASTHISGGARNSFGLVPGQDAVDRIVVRKVPVKLELTPDRPTLFRIDHQSGLYSACSGQALEMSVLSWLSRVLYVMVEYVFEVFLAAALQNRLTFFNYIFFQIGESGPALHDIETDPGLKAVVSCRNMLRRKNRRRSSAGR